jgi:hypothetical protein
MKNKLLFLYAILICSIFFGCLTTNVKAANGPSSESGVISFMSFSDDYDSFDIYDSGKITNNDSKGVTYDLSSNTLTIKDFNGKYELTVSGMGEDFKLNVVGINDFLGIYVGGYSYKTNITFTGNGTLILNKDKDEDRLAAIASADKSKLIFEDTVSLRLYVVSMDDPLYPSVVIGCSDMESNDDKNSCITFKGNNNVDVIIQQRMYEAYDLAVIKGFAILPEDIEIFKTATKDSKKYAYTVGSDNKVTLYLNELREDPYSHKWYIGNTYSDINNKTTYDNTDALETAGYSLVEDKAYRAYYELLFLLRQDQDGKQYGLIDPNEYDVAPDGIPFDITDKTITINSVRHKYLEYSDVDPTDLERVSRYEYLDEYIHYVKGDSLIIDGVKQTNVVNPKTGDMNLLPYSLILIIGMIYSLFFLNKNNKFKRNI